MRFKWRGYRAEARWDPDVKSFSGEVVNMGDDPIRVFGPLPSDLHADFRSKVDEYLVMWNREGVKPMPPS